MQRQQSTIARWCSWIIEGGWLFALVLIPSYFNLLSSRHFEPDKATALRAIVLMMFATASIYWLDRLGTKSGDAPVVSSGQSPGWWRRLIAFPMALPVLLYALVFLIATVLSITPSSSLWGSYQRLQGTYTNLAYIGLGLLMVLFLRRREQIERLVMVAVLGSLPAIGYGLIQHAQVDPLPWKGDVISRVASTMGNSIFVAAYLIMILPFALYLALSSFQRASSDLAETGKHSSAASTNQQASAYGWAGVYTLAVIGALLLVYGAVCFGAVVRVADLRYWWVYPGALFAAFSLFVLPTLRPHRADRVSLTLLWPGIVALGYVLLLGVFFAAGSASAGQEVRSMPGRGGTEWWLYILGAVAAVIGAYALVFTLPRSNQESRTLPLLQGIGMSLISLLIVVTIIFTQSRGPWIGGIVGVLVFITALLVIAWRRAHVEGSPRAGLWRNLLIAELVVAIFGGGFLAAFNLIDAPVFVQLRSAPYIGRMGRLLETDQGTGLVRRLIWTGDEHAGGAVGLITSDPLRTIVGWGPESMFVAYNKFYPPALANIEARGASPDRSHEAYLDELVTKGVLGLASYLFVIISALTLAITLIRRTDDWRFQVLFSACLATIVANAIEGLTGIPIVATLMLLWVSIGLIVSIGVVMGQYSFAAQPKPVEVAPEVPAAKAPAGKRQKGAVARGAAQTRGSSRRQQTNPLSLLVYAIVLGVGLAVVWFTNVDNVYADMRFQQGQIYAENPNASTQELLLGAEYYIDAIRMEPNQDFYYLSLGRSLMSLADISRQTNKDQLGAVKPDASLRDLLMVQDPKVLLAQQSALANMSYAEAVLKRAYDLSPLNKDHSANLGRLYSFWYSRMGLDPSRIEQSVEWYARGNAIAPQDVVILNEYAGAVALQGTYSQGKGDTANAQAKYDEASKLLARSKQLDAKYGDTDARSADLLRVQGRTAEALDLYLALLARNPHSLDTSYNLVVASLRDKPDELKRFRAAYEQALAKKPDDKGLLDIIGRISVPLGDLDRATSAFSQQVALDPQNVDARRNLIVVLSDTKQYVRAADEADAMLKLLQAQGDTQQAQQLQSLAAYYRQLAGP